MSLATLAENAIGRLKAQPNYAFEKPLSNRALCHVLWSRGLQILRGLWVRLKLHKVDGLLFAGRRVVKLRGEY